MPRPCTRPPQSTFEGHKCIETGPLYQIIKIMIVVRTARIDWQQKLLEDVFLLNLMQTIRSKWPKLEVLHPLTHSPTVESHLSAQRKVKTSTELYTHKNKRALSHGRLE